VAARKLKAGERVLDIRPAGEGPLEGYQVHSLGGAQPEPEILADAPPERFTERMAHESGEVRVSPLVEAMRRRLQRRQR
jgi:hypothetical protein